jgi:hypothetical protein
VRRTFTKNLEVEILNVILLSWHGHFFLLLLALPDAIEKSKGLFGEFVGLFLGFVVHE